MRHSAEIFQFLNRLSIPIRPCSQARPISRGLWFRTLVDLWYKNVEWNYLSLLPEPDSLSRTAARSRSSSSRLKSRPLRSSGLLWPRSRLFSEVWEGLEYNIYYIKQSVDNNAKAESGATWPKNESLNFSLKFSVQVPLKNLIPIVKFIRPIFNKPTIPGRGLSTAH